jgi:DNA ligase-4
MDALAEDSLAVAGAAAGSGGEEKCEDNCNKFLFAKLCEIFDNIERASGQRRDKLSLIFTPELRALVQGQSVFPLVRLLLPPYDTARGGYGLKQATVAKTYVGALQLNHDSEAAQRLIHWKKQSKRGDFCSILEEVLLPRAGRTQPSAASLGHINALLDSLTEAYGETGKVAFISEHVLNKFNPREQKWLMRIIFQDLKLGLKLESVLGALSPWASQIYDESTDLRLICEGGRGKYRPKGLRPHAVFAPMLAKGFPNTGQLLEVERAMGGAPFVMDVKLDGERMLCHVTPEQGCRLITRNGTDYTDKYRALARELGNKLEGCHAYILDGEVCAWDGDTGRFVAFGSNRGVGNAENGEQASLAAASPAGPAAAAAAASSGMAGGGGGGAPSAGGMRLVYIAFDVVYAEGTHVAGDMDRIMAQYAEAEAEGGRRSAGADAMRHSGLPAGGGELTQLPLLARRGFLRERLVVLPNRVIHVQHELVAASDVGERQRKLESYFNEMMEKGEEGLVVKDWTSPYELGEKSRSRDAKWIKMKPEYSNNMTDFDLLILGGYYGEGMSTRGDGISHFLLGVKDEANSTEEHTKYLTCGKVGTGYTFAELKELRDKLAPHWQQWPGGAGGQRGSLPDHFSPWTKVKREDVPHLWYAWHLVCLISVCLCVCKYCMLYHLFSDSIYIQDPAGELIHPGDQVCRNNSVREFRSGFDLTVSACAPDSVRQRD